MYCNKNKSPHLYLKRLLKDIALLIDRLVTSCIFRWNTYGLSYLKIQYQESWNVCPLSIFIIFISVCWSHWWAFKNTPSNAGHWQWFFIQIKTILLRPSSYLACLWLPFKKKTCLIIYTSIIINILYLKKYKIIWNKFLQNNLL